jgi:hypothetical protein
VRYRGPPLLGVGRNTGEGQFELAVAVPAMRSRAGGAAGRVAGAG